MELKEDNLGIDYISFLFQGKIEKAIECKRNAVAPRLYKFEPYEESRIKTLELSKVFLSSPRVFNDVFDTKGIFYSEEFLKKVYSNNDFDISFEDFSTAIEATLNNFYEHSGIACFSEDLYNFPMWGNYADNRKGFCTEYEIFDKKVEDYFLDRLYKVIYLDKKYNFEKILEALLPKAFNGETIPQSADMLLYSLLGTIKHNSWSYEKEWRYIIPEKFKEQDFPFTVKAIYLGDRFNEENYDRMKEISKKLNCELYKMTAPKHFDIRYTFIPQRII